MSITPMRTTTEPGFSTDLRLSTLQWRAGSRTAEQTFGGIHLVGIGGIGMSGIAEVLLTLGYRVSGSDLRQGQATRRLQDLGATVFFGHDASNLDADVEVVVVSSAIDDANPEVRAARDHLVPVIPRAEMLAELMRASCGVGVAGAHGKTTTTSLLAAVLAAGGFDPTIVIGGRVRSLGDTTARLGRSQYMVAEADESDGSFLLLKPTVAVITNIDREHMQHYGTMERLVSAYVEYANGVPFYGRTVLCSDCEEVRRILPRLRKRYITYGTRQDADLRAVDLEYDGLNSSFGLLRQGRAIGRVQVSMPGEHSVLNALAATAVALEFGMTVEQIAASLADFQGIRRRFEYKGEAVGISVYDDYGHHPTEIRATLAAARRGLDGRLVAVFQPHRYSRLQDLHAEFLRAFDHADEIVVTDVYAAGESPVEGVDGCSFAAELARCHPGKVRYHDGEDLAAVVVADLKPGSVVITLGAGDITQLGSKMLDHLHTRGTA